jgi:hypothetical protein
VVAAKIASSASSDGGRMAACTLKEEHTSALLEPSGHLLVFLSNLRLCKTLSSALSATIVKNGSKRPWWEAQERVESLAEPKASASVHTDEAH